MSFDDRALVVSGVKLSAWTMLEFDIGTMLMQPARSCPFGVLGRLTGHWPVEMCLLHNGLLAQKTPRNG